jgi:hypothetical protein
VPGAVFSFRYGGQWIEGDTSVLTRVILLMQSEGTLITQKLLYPHGILFQASSVLLSNLSGIRVVDLQRMLYPSISIILLISAAWFFYIQASRRTSVAALAVLLLLLQPEVLFVVLRGSHEKLDWPLMMLALALLYHSLGQRGPRLALQIAVFYLVAFAQISINVYFASTYLTAILLSLMIGITIYYLQKRKQNGANNNPERLLYVGLSVSILLFLFITSLYPPAINSMRTAQSIYQQLSNLMVNPETAAQPYDYIAFGWINTHLFGYYPVHLVADHQLYAGMDLAWVTTAEGQGCVCTERQPGLAAVRRICAPGRDVNHHRLFRRPVTEFPVARLSRVHRHGRPAAFQGVFSD